MFIPDPVLIELEEHWISDFTEKLDSLQQHAGEVLPALLLPADVLFDYRHFVESVMNNNRLGGSPFTSRSLEYAFRMSARHVAPFQQDNFFRDGIIQFSILDDLKSSGSVGAIL